MTNKKGYSITIQDEQYIIYCEATSVEKARNKDIGMGIKAHIKVIRLHDNLEIPWEKLKGSHLADKVEEFLFNVLNGEATFFPRRKRRK